MLGLMKSGGQGFLCGFAILPFWLMYVGMVELITTHMPTLSKDLAVFNLPWNDPRNNNNGWPGERPLFTRQWWDPQEEDQGADVSGGGHSAVPW